MGLTNGVPELENCLPTVDKVNMNVTLAVFCIVASISTVCAAYHNEEEGRWYFPEFKLRAEISRDESRPGVVERTLKEAAGLYRDKKRATVLGLEKTVFVSVVAYSEKPSYKLHFHNLLCYAQHHNIEIVAYILHHNLTKPEQEFQQLKDAGIKVLTYPDELFWTLLYTKDTQVETGSGKGEYLSKVPSFASHGSLVMLVPVLEALLHGYNVIFMDVDVALVLDPIPYLMRGHSDFVTSVEMRHCPEYYTPTYLNGSTHADEETNLDRTDFSRTMEGANWYTVEPNTGVMLVRSNEATIGFYTRWLTSIISLNDLNDQKSFWREPDSAESVRDCVYGPHTEAGGSVQAPGHSFGLRIGRAAGGSVPNHLRRPRTGLHDSTRDARKEELSRRKWLGNFTTLVTDVSNGRYRKPVKFCFLSEMLFQNGMTAFHCGAKPVSRDSWFLEMNKHGLQTADANGEENLHPHDENRPNTPRYPVAVHANYCGRKIHELTVRGLWLVREESPSYAFNQSTCRAFVPRSTLYGTTNWVDEARLVRNKRKFMYDTFVVPGGLIQSARDNVKEVYLVDADLRKQLVPDAETLAATVGTGKGARSKVRQLPPAVMDKVQSGRSLPSVRNASNVAELAAAVPSSAPLSVAPP